MQNINRVVLTGNLTRDPELRQTGGGLSICSMRLACNTRRKNGATGEWEDKPCYFDVTVFGAQGENCTKYLAKGRGVVIDGRLDWREWEKDGAKHQAVQIIAENVQFLPDGNSERSSSSSSSAAPVSRPADPMDDDIPFLWREPTWDKQHSNR